jgi:preprotein translocase subunit SecF
VSTLRAVARGEAAIDFTVWWKRGLILSAVLIVISLGSLFTRGLELGIDFEGGTSWEVPAPGVSVADTRDALGDVGQAQAKIQIVGDSTLRVQSATETPDTQQAVRDRLAELAGVPTNEVSVSTVGPTWGDEITSAAVRALVVFFAVMMLYLSIRLEWQMGIAALVAMLHDIIVTVGVYSIFQFEVTPATVIAFLTILGYSIYDTVVVFDQVKQNQPRVGVTHRLTYTDMVSQSMNQVLIRSLNTSITSLLPVVALLLIGSGLLGAVTLQEFGIALFVGLLVGVYSSIFVAAPILAVIKERDPRNRSVRERLEVGRPTSPVAGDPSDRQVTTTAPTPASARTESASKAPTPSTTIPPRPRKKSKRR